MQRYVARSWGKEALRNGPSHWDGQWCNLMCCSSRWPLRRNRTRTHTQLHNPRKNLLESSRRVLSGRCAGSFPGKEGFSQSFNSAIWISGVPCSCSCFGWLLVCERVSSMSFHITDFSWGSRVVLRPWIWDLSTALLQILYPSLTCNGWYMLICYTAKLLLQSMVSCNHWELTMLSCNR